MENVCLTLVSAHGVNLLRPVSTLLRILQSSPMASAGIGMTGKKFKCEIDTRCTLVLLNNTPHNKKSILLRGTIA